MWLVAEVSDKQPFFYIEALQKFVNAWAKNFKVRRKRIWTWYRKSKSTEEAKFVLNYHIFRFVTRFPIQRPKGGTFLPACKPISLGRLLRGFHRNASTAQFYVFCERFKEKTKLRDDSMLRQITESLWVSHVKKDEHIITKAEWNYLAFPRTVITCM